MITLLRLLRAFFSADVQPCHARHLGCQAAVHARDVPHTATGGRFWFDEPAAPAGEIEKSGP